MRQYAWQWRQRAGRCVGALGIVMVVLTACASPEKAVETSVAMATTAAESSGPPALRIATVGIGPTAAVGSAAVGSAIVTERTTGSPAVASTMPNGTPHTATGSSAVAGKNNATTTPRSGTAMPTSMAQANPNGMGTPEPGVLLDPKGKYSFRIPTLWRTQIPMASGVDLEAICDDPNGLLRTTSVNTDAAVTLDSATTIITEALKKNTANYEPVPSGSLNAMIGGQPARRIEYYGIYSGTRLHYVSYVIVYNGKTVVTLLFVAQPDNFDRLLMQGSIVLTSFAFIQQG